MEYDLKIQFKYGYSDVLESGNYKSCVPLHHLSMISMGFFVDQFLISGSNDGDKSQLSFNSFQHKRTWANTYVTYELRTVYKTQMSCLLITVDTA